MTGPASAPPSGTGAGGPSGGPPAWLALLAIGGLALGIVLISVQALGLGGGGTAPGPTVAPAGDAAAKTRDVVVAALGDAAFQVQQPRTDYRPGESPALYSAPRGVLQAILPSDPTGGYIVIYELPTNGEADAVGRDFAAYLASGTGAIQYPQDAEFVLRRIGRTIVFFAWSPTVSPDPEVARLAATLTAIGEPVAGS